jgi:hypothetical protein
MAVVMMAKIVMVMAMMAKIVMVMVPNKCLLVECILQSKTQS